MKWLQTLVVLLNVFRCFQSLIMIRKSRVFIRTMRTTKNSLTSEKYGRRLFSDFFIRRCMQTNDNDLDLTHLEAPGSKIDKYWIEKLNQLQKVSARNLIDQLTNCNELGFNDPRTGGPTAIKKDSLLGLAVEHKKNNPKSIILIRVGEFYETFGVDALMMISYAGLNPMAGVCRAGCPVKNVQPTLDCLTAAGFSIAVIEEINDIETGVGRPSSKAKKKDRFLAQIVSPGSSTYLYDLRLTGGPVEFRENRPAVGIIETANGFTLCQVILDEREIKISERLTEEAVRSKLAASGYIEPVYIQVEKDLSFLPSHKEKLTGYSEKDFLNRVKLMVCSSARISDPENFRVTSGTKQGQPRPIYTSTANQIGLVKNSNVPDLIPHLLPTNYNAYVDRFLRYWLQNPPPREVADEMRNLCVALTEIREAIPGFTPVSFGKINSFLVSKQCNVPTFREILGNARSLIIMLQESRKGEGFNKLVEPLLVLTTYACDARAERIELLAGCEKVESRITAVIAPESSKYQPFQDPYGRIPDEFFQWNEEIIRDKINPDHKEMKALMERLEKAALLLCEAVNEEFPLDYEVDKDKLDNAIFMRKKPAKRKTKAEREAESNNGNNITLEEHQFIKEKAAKIKGYYDRKGKLSSQKFTTDKVSEALSQYLEESATAPIVINKILCKLSEDLMECITPILQASHWAVVLQTAVLHSIAASQKGWMMPEMQDFPDKSLEKSLRMDPVMRLPKLVPYWMSGSGIPNTVELAGLFLLTAPNMSGKSTLMRSVLVAALLANCGLFVPCLEKASVPRYDNFFLRTASYDVPSEAKSAFALEMDDVRVVLRDCTAQSIVMLDELGKGTSARDGATLAGALLENLDEIGASGIFATHLHEIFDLPLNLNRVIEKRMSTIFNEEGKLEWTYQLEDGRCTDSMALETAQHYEIPKSIIDRARDLAIYFDENCRNQDFEIKRSEAKPQKQNKTITSTPKKTVKSYTNTKQNLPCYDIEKQVLPIWQKLINNLNIETEEDSFDLSSDPIVFEGNRDPPVFLETSSCMYILHLSSDELGKSDLLYVGETESMHQRLLQHRKTEKQQQGKGAIPTGYKIKSIMAVKTGNKSRARLLETRMLQELKKSGFSLISDSDASHVLFTGRKI